MNKKELSAFLLFFIALLAAGLAVVDDYGISWDEYRQRITGAFVYKYMVEGDRALFDYQDRHYGTAFELPLIILEKALRPQSFRNVFLMRHYATFLFFYLSCLFFYFLSRRLTGSRPLALVAVGMLVVSPRLFAHSFYNSKDIVFMGMFVISIYTMMVFMEKRNVPAALMHAAASAYLADIRVAGIMAPLFTLLWAAALSINEKQAAFVLKRVSLYLVAFACLAILFWPNLWPDPLENFIKALKFMSRHHNIGETLYRGEYLLTDALPWHYLPVWMLITIPPAYSFCFFAGVIGIMTGMMRNVKFFLLERTEELLLLVWFFGPIIAVLAMGSTLYDSWRQFFFIYPAFVIIGVKGIKMVWESSSGGGGRWRPVFRGGLALCLAVNMVGALWFMITYHPYGNLYFNILAGRDYDRIKGDFEMDYWGLAYREALEEIVAIDNRDKITVFAANDPGVLNSFILPEKERRRIWYVLSPEEADYYITNYRWRKKPYDLETEVFSVIVKGAKIVSVFKLDRPAAGDIDVGGFRGSFFEYFEDPSKYLLP